ncbi:Clp protease N-terminal domain-containing protein [Streptomyces sp. NPDC002659]|uniref:Clp protease N-terminal domain-containing protein n=1 Tax=Streptomyces sp. NPDC002659 TaxID=3364656 RepID=UPI0036D1ED39
MGEALGVSRQAAQQRWKPPPRKDRLAAVLDAAEAEAHILGHNETDTGHLLIALTSESEEVRVALASLGVTAEAVRAAVEERWAAKTWMPFAVTAGEFPAFGLDSGAVLRRVEEITDEVGGGPDQLLLAILDCHGQPSRPGREALHALGLTTRQAREALMVRLSG